MKLRSKMYLAALALPAIFASCTQDEVFSGMEIQDDTKERPTVGQVTLVMDNAETRFNDETGQFEPGKDVLGMYLMDEYQSSYNGGESWYPGEEFDANKTEFETQGAWTGMYKLVNYIQTNYPFRLTASETERGGAVWKNDAKLVEGNYFSMFPQQEKATNRRELWHYINPAVQMVKHSTKDGYYHGVCNQFYLGYNQIYRNAEANANGELTVDVKLKGVMTGYKIKLLGWQGADVKLQKISFKSKSGAALPTIAYVEPATDSDWRVWTDAKYDAEKTWTKKTVRSLVTYRTTVDENGNLRIPYQLEEEKQGLVYEYSFAFPEGTILKGDVSQGDLIYAYIVVPTLTEEEWKNIEVDIYGWRWIKDYDYEEGGYWEYGKFMPKTPNNQWFNIQNLQPWNPADENNYYQLVESRFDDLAFKAIKKFNVASTDDMENMVRGFLSQSYGKGDLNFVISPDANGIEITKVLVDILKKNSAENNRNITVNFDGDRNGIINFNVNETLALDSVTTETGKRVTFKYDGGIVLNNYVEQTVAASTILSGSFTINNEGTLNIDGKLGNGVSVKNEGTVNVKGTVEKEIKNNKDLNINDGTIEKIVNEANTTSNGGIVTTFENNENLTVATGILNITVLTNNGTITVNSGATLKTTNSDSASLINNYMVKNSGTITSDFIQNNAVIENLGKINAVSFNNGDVTASFDKAAVVQNGNANIAGTINGRLNNRGAVYANKGTIVDFWNVTTNAILYVTAEEGNEVETASESEGIIRFMSVAPQHIGTKGDDKRIFVTSAEDDADRSMLHILKSMNTTNSTYLETASDITFDYNAKDDANGKPARDVADAIKSIKVLKGEKVNFQGAVAGKTYNFIAATLSNEAELHVENSTTIKVNSVDNTGTIHFGTNSSIVNANGVVVDHK